MIRIAICDEYMDEVETIRQLLYDTYGDAVDICDFATDFSLLSDLETDKGRPVDIVIIHTGFQGHHGIAIAGEIQRMDADILIVFLSDDIKAAQMIFQVSPSQFFVTPIAQEAFVSGMDPVIQRAKQNRQNKLWVSGHMGIVGINMDDIFYIESEKRKIHIHSLHKNISVYRKMDEFETILPSVFLRCHQSYLVHMEKIRSFSATYLELCDRTKIPISRNRYVSAREKFMDFLGGRLH